MPTNLIVISTVYIANDSQHAGLVITARSFIIFNSEILRYYDGNGVNGSLPLLFQKEIQTKLWHVPARFFMLLPVFAEHSTKLYHVIPGSLLVLINMESAVVSCVFFSSTHRHPARPVSVLIPHPTEIQALSSQTIVTEKIHRKSRRGVMIILRTYTNSSSTY